MVKARIYVVSLLDFINSLSQTDDVHDVSTRTVGRKVTFLRRGGVDRQFRLPPPGYGPVVAVNRCKCAFSFNIQRLMMNERPEMNLLCCVSDTSAVE